MTVRITMAGEAAIIPTAAITGKAAMAATDLGRGVGSDPRLPFGLQIFLYRHAKRKRCVSMKSAKRKRSSFDDQPFGITDFVLPTTWRVEMGRADQKSRFLIHREMEP